MRFKDNIVEKEYPIDLYALCSEFDLAPEELSYIDFGDLVDGLETEAYHSFVSEIKGDNEENLSMSFSDYSHLYSLEDNLAVIIEELSVNAVIVSKYKKQKFDKMFQKHL